MLNVLSALSQRKLETLEIPCVSYPNDFGVCVSNELEDGWTEELVESAVADKDAKFVEVFLDNNADVEQARARFVSAMAAVPGLFQGRKWQVVFSVLVSFWLAKTRIGRGCGRCDLPGSRERWSKR
jgi:hypothetical protein